MELKPAQVLLTVAENRSGRPGGFHPNHGSHYFTRLINRM
jgi:hypothetical protein